MKQFPQSERALNKGIRISLEEFDELCFLCVIYDDIPHIRELVDAIFKREVTDKAQCLTDA